jgi:hypothetical protein
MENVDFGIETLERDYKHNHKKLEGKMDKNQEELRGKKWS